MKKTCKVFGIGEILWDMLPEGKQFGGAPANFAYHVSQLGATGAVISSVGTGALGREIIAVLDNMGIENYLSETHAPTGTVGVKLEKGIPSYTIYEDVAWDNISLTDRAREELKSADAICFGTLAQRNTVSRDTIWEALELVPETCLKVYDINLRQNYFSREIIERSLQVADVFKLNEEELVTLAELFDLKGSEGELFRLLLETYDLKLLALTKGIEGSILISPEESSTLPTPLVEVADTVGAGDSFTAVLTMGLLHHRPLKEIHELAIQVSGFVCTQNGATPVFPEYLQHRIETVLCN